MNVVRHPDSQALERQGDAHLAARSPAEAAEAFAEAADRVEVPKGPLLVKLGRALLEAGHPGEAAAQLLRVVDTEPGFRVWTAASGLLARCPPETWPRLRRTMRLGLVSTWTTGPFAPFLRLAAARLGVALDIREPDFGQYFNATLDPGSTLYRDAPPEAIVLAPDHRALGVGAFSETPEATVEAELARFAGVWEAVRRAAAPVVVQHGFAAPGADPLGHLAAGLPGSRRAMIARINEGLARRAAETDIGFLDTATLVQRVGESAWFDDRGWHMAKMPYAPAALPLLARHTAAVLAARLGLSRRVLVVDLDNTLWGGVIGDDGLEGIVLGGGTAGEAYVEFQAAIKALLGRGIVLAVASKNDPDVALGPFQEHPEMILREADIAAFAASWGPKSEGIASLAGQLGLGLDSFVFLDDNPYERAEVRRALPEVDVPVLPEEPTGFARALADYPYLEPATFTAADAQRTAQYRARAAAEAVRASAGSLDEYQASLGMTAQVGRVDAVNLPRVVQLINKTNQFNLTTIRRNRAEVEALLARETTRAFWVRLSDKFADHGLIAVLIGTIDGPRLEIDTFLMSCRVLGRGVEALAVAEMARLAAEAGCVEVTGRYVPSGRNGMVADLYTRLGFEPMGPGDGRNGDAGETRWRAAPKRLTEPDVPIHLTRV